METHYNCIAATNLHVVSLCNNRKLNTLYHSKCQVESFSAHVMGPRAQAVYMQAKIL